MCLCRFLEVVKYQPELAVSAHAVVLAVCAAVHVVRVVVCVSVGDVQAETFLIPSLLCHKRLSMTAG